MASVYLTIIVIVLAALFLQVARAPSLIFEYPYMMASVFAIFILPQAFSLIHFPGRVSQHAIDSALLVTLLCLLAAILGYQVKPSMFIAKQLIIPVNEKRILHVSACFIVVGLTFFYLLMNIPIQTSEAGGWTGRATIYLFFAGLINPGLAMALSLLLRKKTFGRATLTAVASLFPLYGIYRGRREGAVLFILIVLLGLFFTKRKTPPRVAIFGGLFLFMLIIPAIGSYRNIVQQVANETYGREYKRTNFLAAVSNIHLYDNFVDFMSKESILELRNAAALIESTERFHKYQLGAGYWNNLVFRFVPAQLIGRERKQALMIGDESDKLQSKELLNGYVISTGTTPTGIGDSFMEFGWFGCLFYAFLAIAFRTAWVVAFKHNGLFAQLLYLLVCTSGMRSVTHGTVDFLPGLIFNFTFLRLGMFYAAERRGEASGNRGLVPLPRSPSARQLSKGSRPSRQAHR